MQLYPTRSAVHLALAGIVILVLGLTISQAAILAWGGAVILGLAVARSVTLMGVATIRAAGFEMLWREKLRVARTHRGQRIELSAEVRNRDTRAARYVNLRAVHSPDLEVTLDPASGEVPAGGRLSVTVNVKALRVGQHGIFGLSLELQGAPGLFEVPLTFANPFGIEVLPKRLHLVTKPARGGRSRHLALQGRSQNRSGESSELRELREHQAGDPFKRIAWKASAKRGQLLVREYESEEHDVVWIVLDASVESWWGSEGRAPLDYAIDDVAAIAHAHLERRDSVGLIIAGSRLLAKIPPHSDPAQMSRILSALMLETHTYDYERSGLDDGEVAAQVLEHMRPLDPQASLGVSRRQIDIIARRAQTLMNRAPFEVRAMRGRTANERVVRRYMAAFGMHSPPRYDSDRQKVDQLMGSELKTLFTMRRRPSLVYACSPPLDGPTRRDLAELLSGLNRRRTRLRWIPTRRDWKDSAWESAVGSVVRDAIELRAQVAEEEGDRELRKLGVHKTTLHVVPTRAARDIARSHVATTTSVKPRAERP